MAGESEKVHGNGIDPAAEAQAAAVSGANANASGDAGGNAEPAGSAAEQNGTEANATPSAPDFVPRSLMNAQMEEMKRKLQSAKDREVAELRRQLQSFQAANPSDTQSEGMPNANARRETQGFDRSRAMELAEKDVGEAFDYLHQTAVQAAQASLPDMIREAMRREIGSMAQQQAALQQYGGRFDACCQKAGLSDDEYQRAVEYARESMQDNVPTIPPEQAILMARFGSMDAAMDFASQGYRDAAAHAAANPGQPPAGETPPLPKPPGPPPVPGGGANRVQGAAAPKPDNPFRPEAYRNALR